jgi:hypothetical protein
MIACNGRGGSVEDGHALAQLLGGPRIEGIHTVRRAWPCVIDMRPI